MGDGAPSDQYGPNSAAVLHDTARDCRAVQTGIDRATDGAPTGTAQRVSGTGGGTGMAAGDGERVQLRQGGREKRSEIWRLA